MLRIFLFLCLLIAWPNLRATACSCVGTSTVAGGLKGADFVAVGTVKARTRVTVSTILKSADQIASLSASDTTFLFYRYRYTIEIEEVYKGAKKEKTVEIFTGAGGGDCGVQFAVGSKYVIYASLQRTFFVRTNGQQVKAGPFLTTNICTRTKEADKAEMADLRKATAN
jgi:hypothetical protein